MAIKKSIAWPGGTVFSPASSCHDQPRSHISAVVVLVVLLLAPIGATRPQDDASAGRGRTQDGPAVVRETTFVQRVLEQLLKDAAARRVRDSLRRDSASRQVPQTRMPNLVGMDTLAAIRTLRVMTARRLIGSLSYTIVPPDRTSIPVDRIVDQLPAAGTLLGEGLLARLTLGGVPRPPDSVSVPRVIGLRDDEAARALRAARLVTERLEQPVTAPERIGRVTVQKPDSGRRLAVGGRVSIWIGQDARVFMPKVTGVGSVVARARLRAVGIDGGRTQWDTTEATTSIGSVVAQRPAAGTVLLPTTRIVLTQVVRPPPPAIARIPVMPMVVGRDSASAVRMLVAAGLLNYRILLPVDTAADDVVRAQSPEAGRRIRADSLVVLTLQARPPAFAETLPVPPAPSRDWFGWFAVAVLVLAAVAATALGARTIWPPPKIVPRLRVQPQFAEVVDADGSLVEVSVSLRSRIEHQPSALDLTGSPLV